MTSFSESELTSIACRFRLCNRLVEKIPLLDDYLLKWAKSSNDQRHIAILGEYGTGKTSLCQKLARDLAQSCIESPNRRRGQMASCFVQTTSVGDIYYSFQRLKFPQCKSSAPTCREEPGLRRVCLRPGREEESEGMAGGSCQRRGRRANKGAAQKLGSSAPGARARSGAAR
jgi:hypothetical protein